MVVFLFENDRYGTKKKMFIFGLIFLLIGAISIFYCYFFYLDIFIMLIGGGIISIGIIIMQVAFRFQTYG